MKREKKKKSSIRHLKRIYIVGPKTALIDISSVSIVYTANLMHKHNFLSLYTPVLVNSLRKNELVLRICVRISYTHLYSDHACLVRIIIVK